MGNKPENNTRMKRTYSIGINEEKKVDKEKTPLQKTASFLTSMYYNVSKTIIVSVCLVGCGVLITNYNVFPILEKIFVREEGSLKLKETLIKIDGLNLNDDFVTEEEFKTVSNRVLTELSSVILDENLFREGQDSFSNRMRVFYTQDYSEKVITDDVLYNALKGIYSSENRYPTSITMTSIGKVVRDKKPIIKAVVDINGEDDDLGFHVSSIAMFFNDRYEIQDIKLVFEDKEYASTRTPLDIEHSLVNNSSSTIMNREVNKFFKEFSNKTLYDKVQMSAMDINNSQLKSFFSNLDIENKDYNVLSELFNLAKGNSSNIAIIEYMQTDFDTNAITSIILAVKTSERTYKYNLQFDRSTETLIGLTEI